jgi:ketosteroid isomerase-like protein
MGGYCKAMSQENVEIVTGLYTGVEAMNKEDLLAALPELIRQGCDPEIEWVEDPKRADSRTYRGHDGVLASFERWFEGFDEYGAKLERIVDCGDRVFVAVREEGRGAISGATVGATNYQVITFREGKVLRYQEFYDEADALEAAGLSE